MPNARPAFMEKVLLTATGDNIYRFYPKRSVDTWEVIVNGLSGQLKFEGVAETWTGEDYNVSSGTKTIKTKNPPSSAQLVTISTKGEFVAGGDDAQAQHFAIDLGFKAIQVTLTVGGTATVFVKAYEKNGGMANGSGYITGDAQDS